MILTGDPILEDIRFVSLESGIPFLSFSPPLSPYEIRDFIDKIDESKLSDNGKEAYSRILKRLSPSSRISYSDNRFTLLMDIDFTLESTFRSNTEISLHPFYPNVTPLISIPVRLHFKDLIVLYIEPIIAMNSSEYAIDNFGFNIPLGYEKLNHDPPLRAFAAIGGDCWNFQIGRDRLYWGTSLSGSLTFNDNSQYFDFARLSIFTSNVKYSFIVNQLPLRLQKSLFTDDWWTGPGGNGSNVDSSTVMQRYFYLHRLDFKLFNKVSIALMEGLLAGNNPFELRYLNPAAIFHAFFAWDDYDKWDINDGDMIGSFASLEINYNITENLSVYVQWVVNELTFGGENNLNPNSLAYLAGVQFAHNFSSWSSLSFLEIIYTDPYFSILSTPYASFIQMDRLGRYYYIGYPRDTFSISAGTLLKYKDTFNININLSWISSGEHGLIWNWEEGQHTMNERTPTGTAENKFILSLGGGWKVNQWLLLKTNLTGILSLNNNHISGNNTFGIQAALSAGVRF